MSACVSVRAVPKFMKRSKVPDYRDKHVFGVPPIVNVQRTGQPLPQSIQQAMRYLRSQCLGQVLYMSLPLTHTRANTHTPFHVQKCLKMDMNFNLHSTSSHPEDTVFHCLFHFLYGVTFSHFVLCVCVYLVL